MEKVKVLESKHLNDDVYFLRINYLGKEYAETISVSGLELALKSMPENKKEIHLAFQQAIKQINEPEPEKIPESEPEPESPKKSRKSKLFENEEPEDE